MIKPEGLVYDLMFMWLQKKTAKRTYPFVFNRTVGLQLAFVVSIKNYLALYFPVVGLINQHTISATVDKACGEGSISETNLETLMSLGKRFHVFLFHISFVDLGPSY
jgi:hypothetical protein